MNITAVVVEALAVIPDIEEIERFANIDIEIVGYLPLIDPLGPYAFFPSHCFPQGVGSADPEFIDYYNSPNIGYIRTNNTIEADMIEHLESLFKFQKELTTGAAAFSSLGMIATLIDPEKLAMSFIREDEY